MQHTFSGGAPSSGERRMFAKQTVPVMVWIVLITAESLFISCIVTGLKMCLCRAFFTRVLNRKRPLVPNSLLLFCLFAQLIIIMRIKIAFILIARYHIGKGKDTTLCAINKNVFVTPYK